MKSRFTLASFLFLLVVQTGCGQKPDSAVQFPAKKSISTVNGLQILEPGDEVFDPKGKLVWQRCSWGEKWSGSICEGSPQELTFAEAQKQIPKGWRMPTIRELSTLVDCQNGYQNTMDLGDGLPAINDTCKSGSEYVFPLHLAFHTTKRYDLRNGVGVWSTTTDKTNVAYNLIVFFKYGQINGLPKKDADSKVYVRYVRDQH